MFTRPFTMCARNAETQSCCYLQGTHTYAKTGAIERRSAWSLCKDDPPSMLNRICESFCAWMLHPGTHAFTHACIHLSIHPTYPFTYLFTDSPVNRLSTSPFPATHVSISSSMNPPIHRLMGAYAAPISVMERMARPR